MAPAPPLFALIFLFPGPRANLCRRTHPGDHGERRRGHAPIGLPAR